MVDRRARELGPHSALRHRLLAPLYAMALVGAPARLTMRAWTGLVLIVVAVLVVRTMSEPWRGIVDLSVALALLIGLGALVRRAVRRNATG